MTYSEKLQSELWQIRRMDIFERDNFLCKICNKPGFKGAFIAIGSLKGETCREFANPFVCPPENGIALNAHHTCYRNGREPWEYDDSELITLCPECHKKIHEETEIPVFNNEGNKIGLANKCERCGGFGYIPKYAHVQSGICFKCWGEGVLLDNLQ